MRISTKEDTVLTGEPENPGTKLAPQPNSKAWKAHELTSFRFAFVFFALYNSNLILEWFAEYFGNWIHVFQTVSDSYRAVWHQMVLYAAKCINFQGDISDTPWAPGDNAHGWLRLLCIFAITTIAGVIWNYLDRKRNNYATLNEWFRLLLRLSLSYWLLVYGIGKLNQFPEPVAGLLARPIGDLTPASLLWLFMGSSKIYCCFAAFAEIVPALFLLSRRLTLVGAVLAAAAMTNVFVLNVAYDVTVKQWACFMLISAFALIAPDLPGLWQFLVLNKQASKTRSLVFTQRVWLNTILVLLPALVALHAVFVETSKGLESIVARKFSLPLKGAWKSSSFKIDGMRIDQFEKEGWQRISFDYRNIIEIAGNDGSNKAYFCKLSNDRKSLTIGKVKNPEGWARGRNAYWEPQWLEKNVFAVHEPTNDTLFLAGHFQQHAIEASFQRLDELRTPLLGHMTSWLSKKIERNLTRAPQPE